MAIRGDMRTAQAPADMVLSWKIPASRQAGLAMARASPGTSIGRGLGIHLGINPGTRRGAPINGSPVSTTSRTSWSLCTLKAPR